MILIQAVPPGQKKTNMVLRKLRHEWKGWPMRMPTGMRHLLAVLADESYPAEQGAEDDAGAQRVARTTLQRLGELTDTSARTVGRRLPWLEANGFIRCLKEPAPGRGPEGAWLLMLPERQEEFIEPAARQIERKRLAQLNPAVPPVPTRLRLPLLRKTLRLPLRRQSLPSVGNQSRAPPDPARAYRFPWLMKSMGNHRGLMKDSNHRKCAQTCARLRRRGSTPGW